MPGVSQNQMKTGMSFWFFTSLDLPVGLHKIPFWKSLLLSLPVCAFSPVAVFPFIISHQQVRAFLFPYFCHVRTPPGQLQLVGRLLIHVFRDFPSGKVLYLQWYLRGFQTN